MSEVEFSNFIEKETTKQAEIIDLEYERSKKRNLSFCLMIDAITSSITVAGE